MNNSTELILQELAQGLSKERKVRFAYVYGSLLTRRDARDVDVAVYLNANGDPRAEAEKIAGHLEKAIAHRRPVDLHLLNDAAPAFAFQVLSRGRLLLERRRDQRVNWEAHVLSRFQDIKPLLDFHDKKFLSS